MGHPAVSLWWSDVGAPPRRPSLDGDVRADVCVVGAGYTGLWTAYYLKRAAPELRIVVVEQRFAGFGASGRNGGWLTNTVTGGLGRYEHAYGRDAAQRMQSAATAGVHEVVAVLADEGIDADVVLGGELTVARNEPQLARLRAEVGETTRWADTDVSLLTPAETAARVGVDSVLGAAWHPHAARIHPAKLVAGLARVVEALGVEIVEQTRAVAIEPGRVRTVRGDVLATFVVRATEGFTAGLAGQRRTWLPMNSSIIATGRLPDQVWAEIGWRGCEVLGDAAHAYLYAQRTADGRIALGGRGVPYRYGSRTDTDGRPDSRTVAMLTGLLHDAFPLTRSVPITHAWSGVLGVPRDWLATVGLDQVTGLGWAGGYVGTGVASANLAGRTLRDLILGRDSGLVDLPWVGHRARRWEPEPLRWLGVHSLYGAYRAADRTEFRRNRPSRLAAAADRVSGRG